MDINNSVKLLVENLLGYDSYRKGLSFYEDLISYKSLKVNGKKQTFTYRVESEISYNKNYKVTIEKTLDDITDFYCTCPRFAGYDTCKHVAAVMLYDWKRIWPNLNDIDFLTDKIFDSFSTEEKPKNQNVKEKVDVELEFNFENTRYPNFRLYIGQNKKYLINKTSKINEFISAVNNGFSYRFGAKFTFDAQNHYLDEEGTWLLNFALSGSSGYYDGFDLSNRELSMLLERYQNKTFKVKNYGSFNGIVFNKLPTKFVLTNEKDKYILRLNDFDNYLFIASNFIKYNNKLYITDETYLKIFDVLNESEFNGLSFKKDKIDKFKKTLLRKIKNNLDVADNIEEIKFAGKPEAEIYIDFLKDKLSADVKFKYGDEKINFLDKNDNIIRDDEEETKVIKEFTDYGFTQHKKKFVLDDIDNIGEFLEYGLDILKEKYSIYTSKKLDNTALIKKSQSNANFSIGKDGILSFDFKLDNIDLDEIDKVLSSLKKNKRYYKLKNGFILNLEENTDLIELNNLVDDLSISSKDLKSGNVSIPKYRAFYIDSLKQNKYKSINTETSFDNFIQNFNNYKDAKVKFSKEDKQILRVYQIDGVKWLYTLYKCDLGGILADEMGLGKSIQTIYFIKKVLSEKKDAKILIVCPTALIYNWVNEFNKFGNGIRYVAVAENKQKRKEIIDNFDNYDVFITTYGLIRNDNDEYENKNFEVCIIDEAQAIKNYQAGMTREVKKIKARTKIALTGTPIENSVLELWSIFDFIMPGYLNSINKFKEKYGIKDVDNDSLERLASLNYQIKPFILRRRKKDVTKELPEKIENNVYLELPKMQKALYVKELNETKREMEELIQTSGFKKARMKILQLLSKLRQICIDPSVLYENYKHESIKIEKLLDIVKDNIVDNHKILIFSSYRRILDKVKVLFDENGISSYTINGSVNAKKRKELVDKFNNDDTSCFLITLKSGGFGLNLTGADMVIHLDIWWNPQAENQATDRAHRIGQNKNVSVVRLITRGTIEERILELQTKKRILSEKLIEGNDDASLINSISEEELTGLFKMGDDEY